MTVPRILVSMALAASVFPAASFLPAQPFNGKPLTPIAASAPTAVPALVPFSGVALTSDGRPLAGEAAITFLIFKDEQGGEPLWAETQTVAFEPDGHYKVQLGASSASGLPAALFVTGEARWLEVQIAGERPQPRALLASVPYALKAGDATTLGGLPVSAFALAGERTLAGAATAQGASPDLVPATEVTTLGGTAGYIPEFSGPSSIVDSPVFVSGGNVGIGTLKPSTALDVAGITTFEGPVTMAESGLATSALGVNSQPLSFIAASYSSLNMSSVAQQFIWKAEPAGNNSLLPSGTLNLLFRSGSNSPNNTGFYFSPNGFVHFAAGQTFPGTGTGNGTITGVTAGTGLTGGGTTGAVTLKVDTTKIPSLIGNNTFTGTETVNGNEIVQVGVQSPQFDLPATTNSSNGLVKIGGVAFLQGYGAAGTYNVFVGGAGNFATTGAYTTATGYQALAAQSSGSSNTAMGLNSLIADNTGGQNTAVGAGALYTNVSGANNTAIGWSAGAGNGTQLSNTTAVGASSTVLEDNAVVLGNTTSTPGAEFVDVGIGTATPISALEASVSAPGAVGAALTLTNPGGDTASNYGAVAVDFNTQPIQARGYSPGARIEAVDDGQNSDSIVFLSNKGGVKNGGLQTNMSIRSNGQVNIGPTVAANSDLGQFTVTGIGFAGIDTTGGVVASGDGEEGIIATGGTGTGGSGPLGGSDGGDGGDFTGGGGVGFSGSGGVGIYVKGGYGGSVPSDAGYFDGDVEASGSFNGGSNDVKIDHPQDAANKYFVHASVESSEMVNIYSGNVVTDELGHAVVHLPDWFEAENGDFRYQLTVLGGRFAQAIVSTEIHDHQFTISTNATGVKVSWQVTGVREDAYAKAHPLVVEQPKNERERGFYIHPELYGQPEEKQLEWSRRPEMMRRMKERREAARQAQKPVETSAGIQPQLGAPASAVDRHFASVSGLALKPGMEPKPSLEDAHHPR